MTWYTTGTINVTKGSKLVTGVGTKWTNPLIGVSAGRMLILQTSTLIEIYEIASIQSDTQLTLAENYGGMTEKNRAYKIPTSSTVSIEQLALEISATLGYYQKQMEGWQTILTGDGDVTLTAPNGQEVTIKSQYTISKELMDAANGAKESATQASKSALNASNSTSMAKTSETNAKKSEGDASNSATAAKTSETNSVAAANGAAKSASSAETSAKAAANSAGSIDGSLYVKKTGDTMLNALTIEGDDAGLTLKNAAGGLWRYKIYPNGDNGLILYDKTKWIVKSYYSQAQKEHRFVDTDNVTINGTPVLKQGDGGLFSRAPVLTAGTDLLTDEVLLVSQTFTLAGVYINSPNDTKVFSGTLEVIRRYYDANAGVTLRLNQGGNVFYVATATKATGAWVSYGWVEQLTSSNVSNYLPIGIPQPWPTTTVPNGWLKCNGSTFNKALYPKLATAYPTGTLPDLRGEFIRGMDDGRGVDSGRAILSAQGDAIRNIVGEVTGMQSYSSGAFSLVRSLASYAQLTNPTQDRAIYAFNAANVVPTANENRPRNIAFLYIVKAE